MIKHACEYCGLVKEYRFPSLVKRFCSHKCSNMWKWEFIRKKANLIPFVCENCQKTFYVKEGNAKVRLKRNHIRFCCLECAWAFARNEPKECKNCKKIFYPNKYRKVFCCHDCSMEYKKLKEKECLGCHKMFLPKRSKQVYCCPECIGVHKHAINLATKPYWYENGYKIILLPNGEHIKEHRYIMEQHIGRKLSKKEIVHHKDGNKLNNNIDNLEIMSASEHSTLHRIKEIKQGRKLFGRD